MPVPLFNQVGTEKCVVALWWKLAWKPNIKFLLPPPKIQRRWLVFLVKCVTAYIRLWLVILWLWWVMLLIWLLLRSLVGYSCACGLLMWLCCCAIGDIHTGVKSGCKLVTLLSFLWYDKLWGPSQRVVTLFSLYNLCANFENNQTMIENPNISKVDWLHPSQGNGGSLFAEKVFLFPKDGVASMSLMRSTTCSKFTPRGLLHWSLIGPIWVQAL